MEVIGISIVGVLIGIGVLLAIVESVAGIWNWVLIIRYHRFNGIAATNGLTGREVAEKLLAESGVTDVAVKPCGFWRMLFGGNSYSYKKKTIFLRKNVIDVASLTATAIAANKAVFAIKDNEGDKKYKSRRVHFGIMSVFGAVAFIPLILIGILVDLALWADFGAFSIVFACIALFLVGYAIYGECVKIKIEELASAKALELLINSGLIVDGEIEPIKKIYKTYIISDIINLILAILMFIKIVLKVSLRLLTMKAK